MTKATAEPTEILVGTRADFADDGRQILTIGGLDIGVLHHGGRFYAYENRCVHQGGPVCEGRVLGKVEAVLGKDKTLLGERFSETEVHLICPWHGYEYNLATGESVVDRRRRLRRFDVVEKGDEIYVVV